MVNKVTVGSYVRRRDTGEKGVVVDLNGGFATVSFAASGKAFVTVANLEPVDADPISNLQAGDFGNHNEFALRLQALYLRHAYKYDPLSGLSNARVEPQLHQVFVAHRVNNKLRPRMILADEVGLGKTIEAGLIMKEQIARGMADRILIVCPASLQYQWQYEMESKFNEEFTILTSQHLKTLEVDGKNPWSKVDRAIVSYNLARGEKRAEQIIEADWDMAIFDEAHHVRRRYEGSDRYTTTLAYKLADEMKDVVDGLLLLTATPMQLHPFELYSLIELVEPGLFPSYEDYERESRNLPELNALMSDLLKWELLPEADRHRSAAEHKTLLRGLGALQPIDELEDDQRREEIMELLSAKHPLVQTLVRNRKSVVGGFTDRIPKRFAVDLKADEWEVYDAVELYIREGYNRAQDLNSNAVGFLMVLYQKLLASSSTALRASFRSRVEKLRAELDVAGAFKSGKLSKDALSVLAGSDDLDDAIAELNAIAANREAAEWEIKTLDRLIEQLGALRDSKAEALVYDIVEPLLRDHPEEKVLIFTGFIQTQEFLATALESAGFKVVIFNGKMDLAAKEEAVRKFRDKAQIMITTEAGGEGRNFQFAHIMVNYDLPWNPMKVEQRIGRLDRIGQTRDVLIYNLSCADTVEDRILDVLEYRIGLFTESVGALDPILGEVEHDIESVVMSDAADLDREFERFSAGIGDRVAEARLKEKVMADFILDRASYRIDHAHELMERKALATWQDLRDFTASALEYYGGRLSPHSEGGYSLSLSAVLMGRLGLRTPTTIGEFNPRLAMQREEVSFFAFGNELIEAVLNNAASSVAHAGCRAVTYAPPGWHVEIIYEMESAGVRPRGQIVRHLVGRDLKPRIETLGGHLEIGSKVDAPEISWLDQAIRASSTAMHEQHSEMEATVNEENEEHRKEELARAARVFAYQQGRLQRIIADEEAWIRARASNLTEGEKRVLPARKGKLKARKEKLQGLRAAYEEQKALIEMGRAGVLVRVISAGMVKGE